jgi:serine-type D-Ala-D-Ala carboxypeptidase (penicillin-binding protein 5/6)
MKLIYRLLLCLALVTPAAANVGVPSPPPRIDAGAYLLLDLSSGQVLASQHEDRRLAPASLTKLMLAYLAFDALKNRQLRLDDSFRVSDKAASVEGSRMFAKAGQSVDVSDLITALIVQSANDAALTLAEGMAGSEAAFVDRMNAQAQKLGLTQTRFRNATGFSDPEHRSSARDMTRLASLLVAHFPADYRQYFSIREFSFNGVLQPNRNRLLWLDPQVDGIKTGHTKEAGYCLIASAERGKRRLIATVMGARSDAERTMYAQKLLNYGFLETDSVRFFRAGQPVATLPVYKGSRSEIGIGFLKDFSLTVQKGAAGRLKAQVITRQPFLAPLREGQTMGTLRMTLDGKVMGDYPLVALDTIPVAGWFGRFWDSLRLLWR